MIRTPFVSNESLRDEVAGMFDKLVETRRDFHQFPELSNREARTAGIVANRLRSLGFDVTAGIAHHGVIGVLHGKGPGRVVAVRADMDALPINETRDVPYKSKNPGVMHACGHDVHTTIGLGVAEFLSRHREAFTGTVKFLFQPAEEGAPVGERGGAALMIDEGALENPTPEAIFGLHVVPTIDVGCLGYNLEEVMAGSARFLITIKGEKGHGAYPHRSVDSIVFAAEAVVQLQTIRSRRLDAQEPMVLSIGSIHGGNRANIIADEVVLEGTVRAFRPEVFLEVERLMHQVLAGLARGFGGGYELEFTRQTPPVINDPQLVRRMLPTFLRIVGDRNVVNPRPRLGAEDFAFFAQKVPAFFYSLGVRNEAMGISAMIHTPEFDVDERCLAIGVESMAALVLDFLAN